jgi:hypothetical protein
MHIFIDANIYLGFYEATSDSLMELEKLITVLKQKKGTKLWLPDQVKREFWKNRDGSVASALKEFTKGSGLGDHEVLHGISLARLCLNSIVTLGQRDLQLAPTTLMNGKIVPQFAGDGKFDLVKL